MDQSITLRNPVVQAPQVAYARLCAIKGVLVLESTGMRGRMGPIRPKIAEELGLRPRDTFEVFIAAVKEKMEAALATQK